MKYIFSKFILPRSGVKIIARKDQLLINGPLGTSFLQFPKMVSFEKVEDKYRVFGLFSQKKLVTTYYTLFLNKIRGVYSGFFETLNIHGVG
jgi:ribosomal protein L6P/L9E